MTGQHGSDSGPGVHRGAVAVLLAFLVLVVILGVVLP